MREGGREGGREGEREREKERGTEGEGGGEREGGRKGERGGGNYFYLFYFIFSVLIQRGSHINGEGTEWFEIKMSRGKVLDYVQTSYTCIIIKLV